MSEASLFRRDPNPVATTPSVTGGSRANLPSPGRRELAGDPPAAPPGDGRATASADESKWQRMFRLARPHRVRLVGAGVVAVSGAMIGLVFPLGLRALLNSVIRQHDSTRLNEVAAGLLLLLLIRGLLAASSGALLKTTGERIVADLRMLLFAHLHRLSIGYFGAQRIGDLSSRLTSDVTAVRMVATEAVIAALLQTARMAGAVGIMLYLNWRLTFIALATAPLATMVSRLFGTRLRKLSRTVQDGLADTNAIAQESFRAVRVVKAFGCEAFESRRYGSAVDHVYDASRRVVVASAASSATVECLTVFALVGLFWFGGHEVLLGRLSGGDVVAFLFYSQAVSQGVSELTQLYTAVSAAAGASERIFGILDTPPQIDDDPTARPLTECHGNLEFHDVVFGYAPGRPVLKGVTLRVAAGTTVAFVGASGGGKSTLVDLIPRFADPWSGRLAMDGRDIRTVTFTSLRKHIAVVSQDVQLFAGTIRDNIRYGRLNATDAEVAEAADDANVTEFTAILPDGLDTHVGEAGVRLSGGQRQRIAIARAFVRRARVVVFDEATSAVDSLGELVIQGAVERLKQRGHTVILVAHRLSTVRRADEICVMHDGVIVERGTHEQLLMRNGAYARFVAGADTQMPSLLRSVPRRSVGLAAHGEFV